MREAEWVERLWQQISQLATQIVTKEDVQRLEGKLNSLAREDDLEKVIGKLDTLLINTATKVEVGRIENRLEHLPLREDVQKIETHLVDFLPQMVTKQEWSVMETRLARTLTKEEFSNTIATFRETLDFVAQRLSEVIQQASFLRNLIALSLVLNAIALLLIVFLLLKMR